MEYKEIQGTDPAFPCNSPDGEESYKGISKRLYIATHLTKGLVAKQGTTSIDEHKKEMIKRIYLYVDELLKQE
jgi:hypothetical protein